MTNATPSSAASGRLEERIHKQETLLMRQRITRMLGQLDVACDELQQLEAEMERFITEYYDQVGGYYEQLEAINHKLACWDAGVALAEDDPGYLQRGPFDIESELKKLYRSMVKEFHPDLHRKGGSVDALREEVMKTLNAAYNQRNFATLWRMKCKLGEMPQLREQETPLAYLQRLRDYYEQISAAYEAMERRRETLEDSPAYALMQRAFEAKLHGQDLIENIVEKMKLQIDAKRRTLVSRKITQLYYLPAMKGETPNHAN